MCLSQRKNEIKIEDIEESSEKAINRKLKNSFEFSKHLLWATKKFKKFTPYLTYGDLMKAFGISRSRAFEILNEFYRFELVYKKKLKGVREVGFFPTKNNDKLVLEKYVEKAEKKFKGELK